MTKGSLSPKSLATIDQRLVESADFVETHTDYVVELFDKLDRAVETGLLGDLSTQDLENLRMLAAVEVQRSLAVAHERRIEQ